jgi:hypothetical protein
MIRQLPSVQVRMIRCVVVSMDKPEIASFAPFWECHLPNGLFFLFSTKRSQIIVGAPLSPTLLFLQTTPAVHLLFTVWWRVGWSLKLFGSFLGHASGPFPFRFCFSVPVWLSSSLLSLQDRMITYFCRLSLCSLRHNSNVDVPISTPAVIVVEKSWKWRHVVSSSNWIHITLFCIILTPLTFRPGNFYRYGYVWLLGEGLQCRICGGSFFWTSGSVVSCCFLCFVGVVLRFLLIIPITIYIDPTKSVICCLFG